MRELREYRMTEEDLAKILDACRPVPYMIFGGIPPRSPQQNANDAWVELGRRMGFDGMTVEPSGRDQRNFKASPTPTETGKNGEEKRT